MWLQSNVGIMDDNTVYEFKSTVRGYHFYREDWKPVCNQLLFCSYEVGNPFDPFAIKVCKSDAEIVGHLPMEISRITKFLLERGFAASLTLTSMHYRRSPLVQGGLEIPCKVRIAMDIRTKRQQDVLDRYKELVREFYYEPSDGEEVVGSFVEYTEYEALSMQLPPKKRKLTDKTEHARSKDESGATDIRNFFTSTRKKNKFCTKKRCKCDRTRLKITSLFHTYVSLFALSKYESSSRMCLSVLTVEVGKDNFSKNLKLQDKCLRIDPHWRNFAGQMFANSKKIRKH